MVYSCEPEKVWLRLLVLEKFLRMLVIHLARSGVWIAEPKIEVTDSPIIGLATNNKEIRHEPKPFYASEL